MKFTDRLKEVIGDSYYELTNDDIIMVGDIVVPSGKTVEHCVKASNGIRYIFNELDEAILSGSKASSLDGNRKVWRKR